MLKKTIMVLILLTVNNVAFGQAYWQVLKDAFTLHNRDNKDFVWVSYPTNNNGILSMGKSKGAKFGLKENRCPTFSCLGLSESLIDTPEGFTVNTRLVTRNSGDGSGFENSVTKKAIIDLALPHFLKIIGLQLNSSRKKVVNFDFSFGSLTTRSILPAEVKGYLNSIDANPNATLTQKAVASLYKQGKLSIITHDIVIDKMDFSVEILKDDNFGIKTELENKIGKVFGQDSTMKVGVSRINESKYKIETTRPLIIARLYQNAKDLTD